MSAQAQKGLSYLGVPLNRPAVAFFDFTSCEGCQLQILNNEASLVDFLNLVEVVTFREAMTERSEVYDIALVEGSVTRADEITRLKDIRERAKVLVALGSCACFGGVNQLKNRFKDPAWVKRQVYGETPIETEAEAKPLDAFVKVDLKIFGCPIKKEEVERIVMDLALGKKLSIPRYPVCHECKARDNICVYEFGQACLGPVTRAGCDAWCPNSRMGCWGCRGPADEPNMQQLADTVKERGVSTEAVLDRLECFGGFAPYMEELKAALAK